MRSARVFIHVSLQFCSQNTQDEANNTTLRKRVSNENGKFIQGTIFRGYPRRFEWYFVHQKYGQNQPFKRFLLRIETKIFLQMKPNTCKGSGVAVTGTLEYGWSLLPMAVPLHLAMLLLSPEISYGLQWNKKSYRRSCFIQRNRMKGRIDHRIEWNVLKSWTRLPQVVQKQIIDKLVCKIVQKQTRRCRSTSTRNLW